MNRILKIVQTANARRGWPIIARRFDRIDRRINRLRVILRLRNGETLTEGAERALREAYGSGFAAGVFTARVVFKINRKEGRQHAGESIRTTGAGAAAGSGAPDLGI